jgi:hypothetical protein
MGRRLTKRMKCFLIQPDGLAMIVVLQNAPNAKVMKRDAILWTMTSGGGEWRT